MKKSRFSVIAAVALSLATTAGAADLPYHGDGHIMLNASELKWGDVASMAPGATIAIIEGDLSKKNPFTFRLRLPANYRIAPHIHPAYERVTVLSGTLHLPTAISSTVKRPGLLKRVGWPSCRPERRCLAIQSRRRSSSFTATDPGASNIWTPRTIHVNRHSLRQGPWGHR